MGTMRQFWHATFISSVDYCISYGPSIPCNLNLWCTHPTTLPLCDTPASSGEEPKKHRPEQILSDMLFFVVSSTLSPRDYNRLYWCQVRMEDLESKVKGDAMLYIRDGCGSLWDRENPISDVCGGCRESCEAECWLRRRRRLQQKGLQLRHGRLRRETLRHGRRPLRCRWQRTCWASSWRSVASISGDLKLFLY